MPETWPPITLILMRCQTRTAIGCDVMIQRGVLHAPTRDWTRETDRAVRMASAQGQRSAHRNYRNRQEVPTRTGVPAAGK